jgi:NTP pyrophosphatase (non-canonical NTP hydrolase)
MTRDEMLLLLIMEEAAEVAQTASKCLRFTPQHKVTKDAKTNFERLKTEVLDLMTILTVYDPKLTYEIFSEEKLEKVEKYFEISRQLGVLNDTKITK